MFSKIADWFDFVDSLTTDQIGNLNTALRVRQDRIRRAAGMEQVKIMSCSEKVLVRLGHKIQATKCLRDRTKMGLSEAHHIILAYERLHNEGAG